MWAADHARPRGTPRRDAARRLLRREHSLWSDGEELADVDRDQDQDKDAVRYVQW